MDHKTLTKQERMVLVLQGVLSEDHLSYEEVKELEMLVLDKVANLLSTNNAPESLQ
jgi:hypothetical protein